MEATQEIVCQIVASLQSSLAAQADRFRQSAGLEKYAQRLDGVIGSVVRGARNQMLDVIAEAEPENKLKWDRDEELRFDIEVDGKAASAVISPDNRISVVQ